MANPYLINIHTRKIITENVILHNQLKKNMSLKPCSDERQNGFKLFKTKTK